jgi:ferredoxin-NADP reductase
MSIARKIRCTVEAIIDHGERVYSIDLNPASPVPPFRPGQFLHLTVDDYDPASFWPESRVFSIATSPRDRRRIRICYSVKGRYTAKMEQMLKVGSEAWIKLPYGEFFIDGATDAVLVAGGTGISAFTAFIEALAPGTPGNVWLAYGVRAPGLLLFRELILEQSRRVHGFRPLFFSETGTDSLRRETASHTPPPSCHPGRISLDVLWSEIRVAEKCVFYLSGPPIMLATLGDQLRKRGLAASQIRTDAWE